MDCRALYDQNFRASTASRSSTQRLLTCLLRPVVALLYRPHDGLFRPHDGYGKADAVEPDHRPLEKARLQQNGPQHVSLHTFPIRRNRTHREYFRLHPRIHSSMACVLIAHRVSAAPELVLCAVLARVPAGAGHDPGKCWRGARKGIPCRRTMTWRGTGMCNP